MKGVVASLIDVPKFKSPYISDYNPDALGITYQLPKLRQYLHGMH